MVRLLLLTLMVAPLAAAFCSALLAEAMACSVGELMPLPCRVWGLEIGPVLHEMLVLGWFSVITIPIGALLLGAYEILHFVQRRRWP